MEPEMATRPRGRRRTALIGGFAAVVVAAVGVAATAFAGSTSLTDDFSDGDTAGWSKSGGSWSVVSDGGKVLNQANAGSELARMFAGDKGWTDYTLQARVRPGALTAGGAAVGVAARATGSSQFQRLVLVPGAARIEEVRGSNVTTLSTVALASAATGWHQLRLDVIGTRVRGYVDNVAVGDVSGRALKAGRVGLLTVHASASFDDVSVSAPAPTPAPTATPTTRPPTATVAPATTAPTTAPASKPPTTAPTSKPAATPTVKPTTNPAATTWPTPVRTETLTETKKVTGPFDGGNVRFIGGAALGDGGQGEGQAPMFQLADGATLSNVIIGTPAADGVHCLGTCTLRNVWWQDVGEDAATFKGTAAGQTMTIDGGGAMHASDKTFQHNGPGTMIIKNFQAADIGKLYRSCGNCSKQFARHVQVSNVTVTVPLKTLVGINPNFGDTAKISDVTVVGGTAKTVICASFKGVTSGEPTEVSKVPDGVNCVATGIVLK
ncbi:pectate lyase [Actinoplanes sp. ATCC 53533]|uniref:pectate lyase n=1 Tax=Actinoplanes sp. ATCC 53533 TaxID=1288362 RepID=UPI001F32C1E1|nr:pectate lyase [Actinoplanes sp. ATCC 53533]